MFTCKTRCNIIKSPFRVPLAGQCEAAHHSQFAKFAMPPNIKLSLIEIESAAQNEICFRLKIFLVNTKAHWCQCSMLVTQISVWFFSLGTHRKSRDEKCRDTTLAWHNNCEISMINWPLALLADWHYISPISGVTVCVCVCAPRKIIANKVILYGRPVNQPFAGASTCGRPLSQFTCT